MSEYYQFDPLQDTISIEPAPRPASYTWLYWLLGVAAVGVVIYGITRTKRADKKEEKSQEQETSS